MSKYVCTICGFIYDETTGYDKDNLNPGTLWSDIPSTWKCPLCGASKADFKIDEIPSSNESKPLSTDSLDLPDDITYTTAELSAIFSNLSKGWEKQYDLDTSSLCEQIADYYGAHSTTSLDISISTLKNLINDDLQTNFDTANQIANQNKDRGGLRALKWAEQVTRMGHSLLNRFELEGPSFVEDSNVYVCEICGFIYIGSEKPEICPVCKVPNMKMTQIERGA